MTVTASSHATVELLSAYLDRQLREPEAGALEAHLEQCEECHGRLEGLREVVNNLRRLDRRDPSPELEKAVARRIALAGDPPGLLDRFESQLSIFTRQSPLLPMFGVVMALAVFIYLFAVAVDRSRSSLTPVVFDVPAPAASVGEQQELAGRTLVWRGEAWVEQGVSAEAASRTLELDSDAGRRAVAERPELAELAELGAPAVIELAGEVVEIR